ncbi:hypothetical protein Patl1_33765 [Pistacia atlantica]|uniref:Uncharacterized protein n=1 Tax=Pistacia atlantica TaxID=434234 RepID=A0ACC0ZUD3_9ROSI|nr:hypothetical protein Patl1_33765 [Pistacia atlantica]
MAAYSSLTSPICTWPVANYTSSVAYQKNHNTLNSSMFQYPKRYKKLMSRSRCRTINGYSKNSGMMENSISERGNGEFWDVRECAKANGRYYEGFVLDWRSFRAQDQPGMVSAQSKNCCSDNNREQSHNSAQLNAGNELETLKQ